uniref:Uncharacterized protein n=1 Tax=Oryza nivara TaxID=4536 RepID=A0A0E0H3S9_ORYNI
MSEGPPCILFTKLNYISSVQFFLFAYVLISRCSFYQQVCESSAWLIRLAEDMLIHRFAASTHCLHFGSDLNIGDHHICEVTRMLVVFTFCCWFALLLIYLL